MKKLIIIVLFFVIIGCDNCDQDNNNTSGDIIFTSYSLEGVAIGNTFDPISLFFNDILIRSKIYDITDEKILFVSESENADTLKFSDLNGSNIKDLFVESNDFLVEDPKLSNDSRIAFFRSGSDLYSLNVEVNTLRLISSDLSELYDYQLTNDNSILFIDNLNEKLIIINEQGDLLNTVDITDYDMLSPISLNTNDQDFIFLAKRNNVHLLTKWNIDLGLQESILVESSITNAISISDKVILFDNIGSIYSILDNSVELEKQAQLGKAQFIDYSESYNTLQISFLNEQQELDLYYYDLESKKLELLTNNGFKAFRN